MLRTSNSMGSASIRLSRSCAQSHSNAASTIYGRCEAATIATTPVPKQPNQNALCRRQPQSKHQVKKRPSAERANGYHASGCIAALVPAATADAMTNSTHSENLAIGQATREGNSASSLPLVRV